MVGPLNLAWDGPVPGAGRAARGNRHALTGGRHLILVHRRPARRDGQMRSCLFMGLRGPLPERRRAVRLRRTPEHLRPLTGLDGMKARCRGTSSVCDVRGRRGPAPG
jgi:hypothetical protein